MQPAVYDGTRYTQVADVAVGNDFMLIVAEEQPMLPNPADVQVLGTTLRRRPEGLSATRTVPASIPLAFKKTVAAKITRTDTNHRPGTSSRYAAHSSVKSGYSPVRANRSRKTTTREGHSQTRTSKASLRP